MVTGQDTRNSFYASLFHGSSQRPVWQALFSICLTLVALLVAAHFTAVIAQAPEQAERTFTERQQETIRFQRSAQPVAGHYIVVFKESAELEAPARTTENSPTREAAQEAVQQQEQQRQQRVMNMASNLSLQYAATREHTYLHSVKGFSAWMSEAQAIALSRDPRVQYVAEDGVVTANDVQRDAPWGLDRIDARNLSFNDKYTWNSSGRGVNAYVIDTGINYTHRDFDGRAVPGFDVYGGNGEDCQGHGSHVASIIGGQYAGVAKNVRLISVRVLNCSGSATYSQVIAGIDWVTANATLPAVANMSLGGPASQALDDAVRKSIARGIVYVVAAGNENDAASKYSPARVSEAITVAATDRNDNQAWFSNYGPLVDLFAPGVAIEGATKGDNNSFIHLSGTSMAAPHVAGAAALFLQQSPKLPPAEVQTKIKQNATKGIVQGNSPSTADLLLFTRVSNDATIQSVVYPKKLRPGQSATVKVTVKNTGATTWFASESYRLGSVTPRDNKVWGLNRIDILSDMAVAPNATVTFSFRITAPAKTGKYSCDWRMVQEAIEWFGETMEATIDVQ